MNAEQYILLAGLMREAAAKVRDVVLIKHLHEQADRYEWWAKNLRTKNWVNQ